MRELKNDIHYKITLDEDQKKVKESIYNSEIVVVTGRAGSGKTLVVAQTVLDLIFKGHIDKVYVTRAAVEVGKTLGYLPGELSCKFDPYVEAFRDNLYACYDKNKVDKHLMHLSGGEENKDKTANKTTVAKIEGIPTQYIRGKTINNRELLVIEEAQNFNENEMEALLTRLGKGGRIVMTGDNDQRDIKETYTGLSFAIEIAKNIKGVIWHKLKANHRSDLVGKILDFKYNK
jgi:phosphate starvation-inducible protein PhoH and related proteins